MKGIFLARTTITIMKSYISYSNGYLRCLEGHFKKEGAAARAAMCACACIWVKNLNYNDRSKNIRCEKTSC